MIKQRLQERFMRYTAVNSQSDASVGIVPSTEGQKRLAELLQADLAELGLTELCISEKSVLTGVLPARLPAGFKGTVPKMGFVAHLDTVNVNLSPEIHPHLHKNYDGGDVCLNEEKNIWLRVDEHPELKKYVGQDIFFSDGTSVLGADNKAAISSMVVALEMLFENQALYHGDLYFVFVPDEEIGLCGAKSMDFAKFPVDFAYTIDCCELGEVVYETFNAGSAVLKVRGVSAHPMSAKGVLVNPTLVAVDFINLFNRLETPENTEGTEGYIWVKTMSSNPGEASVLLNIRDHDHVRYECRKSYIRDAAEFVQKKHPRAVVTCEITDVYGNIADALTEKNRACISYIYKAMENLGIEAKTIAMRGGTDGSFISTKGIPTPNFFTGAHNFHSAAEFLPMDSFEKSCRMVLELIRLVTEQK